MYLTPGNCLEKEKTAKQKLPIRGKIRIFDLTRISTGIIWGDATVAGAEALRAVAPKSIHGP